MAAREGVEDILLQLGKDIEVLRQTYSKLESREVYCQKTKEWFLNRNLKLKTNQIEEKHSLFILPEECKSDMQFCEILSLLCEIKKEHKRLRMLKYQLHMTEKQQDAELLNKIISKQSDVLLDYSHHPAKCFMKLQVDSPLAAWFTEITRLLNPQSAEISQGKFNETSHLFYNVHYSDGRSQPQDLLVERIYKKKKKRDERKKRVFVEELQFSTFHKGYCVRTSIAIFPENRFEEGQGSKCAESLDPTLFLINFDIQLNGMKEQLLQHLVSRWSIEDFVKHHLWNEIENLPT